MDILGKSAALSGAVKSRTCICTCIRAGTRFWTSWLFINFISYLCCNPLSASLDSLQVATLGSTAFAMDLIPCSMLDKRDRAGSGTDTCGRLAAFAAGMADCKVARGFTAQCSHVTWCVSRTCIPGLHVKRSGTASLFRRPGI